MTVQDFLDHIKIYPTDNIEIYIDGEPLKPVVLSVDMDNHKLNIITK